MTRAVNIKAGTILTLSATIKGMPIPKVAWKKNDKEVPLKADIERTAVSSKLEILNTTRDDSGCYSLTVENEAGSKTAACIVTILGKMNGT